ncbi:MAG: hypothetical protein JRG94_06810, partial [Deltaproteobacteria bacterium]|nr:hypothetical protein [Deltaproteobacteria bacterium]
MLSFMLGTEVGMNSLSEIVALLKKQPAGFPETRQSNGREAGPANNWKDVLAVTVKQYHPGPLDALSLSPSGAGAPLMLVTKASRSADT